MKYSFLILILLLALHSIHAQNDFYLMTLDGKFVKQSGLFLTTSAKTLQEATKFTIKARTGKAGLELKKGNEFVSTMDATDPNCYACMLTGLKSNSSTHQITVELLPKQNGEAFRQVALKNEQLNRYLGSTNFNGPIMGKNVRVDYALMSIFSNKNDRTSRFIIIDARAVDIAKALGVEYSVDNATFVFVDRIGYIQNTIEIPTPNLGHFLNQYVKQSDFELYNKEGHSKMRMRLGPATIPYINKPNKTFRKGIPNVYQKIHTSPTTSIDLKIMPYRLKKKSEGFIIQWVKSAFEFVIYFESEDVEFTVEQKVAGKWVDYAMPDFHWDHANIRLRMELEEDPDNIRVKKLYCKSVYGKWGIRGLNGVMTDATDKKLNSSISQGLNNTLAEAGAKEKINEFLTESLEGELKKTAGTNIKLNVGYSNGKLIVKFKIPPSF